MNKLPLTIFLLIMSAIGFAMRDEHCGQAIPVSVYVSQKIVSGLSQALSGARQIPLNSHSTEFLLSRVMAHTVRQSPYETLSFRDVESGLRNASSEVWLLAVPKSLMPVNGALFYPEKLKPYREGAPDYALYIVVGTQAHAEAKLKELGASVEENLERLRNTGWFIPHGEG